MEFNEKLMLETKELMNNCIDKFKEAFDLFQEMQDNPEYLRVMENLVEVNEKENDCECEEEDDEYKSNPSGGCNCCKPSYPCDCKKCDELYYLANREYALSVYAFTQAFKTTKLALHQLEDSRNYYNCALKYYIKAIHCFNKNHCNDFCKKCHKDDDWYYTTCICKD